MTDSAIQVFSTLVKNHPNDPLFRYHFAVALLQKGDARGAKNELEVAFSKGPTPALRMKINESLEKLNGR